MFEDSTHGGRQRNRAGLWGRIISTHALTEGDCHPPERRTLLMKFQLTPSRRATSARVSTDAVEVAFQLTPSRRATHLFGQLSFHILISTHALTEGDRRQLRSVVW